MPANNGPSDDTDSGQITSRVLSFTKTEADSDIRITYTDVFRAWTTSGTARCRWELRVDGASCPDRSLYYDNYISPNNVDDHAPATVVGYCGGLSAGSHELQVYVSQENGGTDDCYTGFNTASWMLEVQEVAP